MTLEEFFEALTECKGSFAWSVIDGNIRGYTHLTRFENCPITAVARAQTQRSWDINDPQKAANNIGLNIDDCENVVYAADGHGSYAKTRARLLACVGLQEGA